jgi:hypothetical protein
MIPDTIVHRKAWMRFFVAAALFNYVIGLPIMLARTWSYNLTYVPSVSRDPMALRLWADFGFAVLLIGCGYQIIAHDVSRNRGIVWLGVIAKFFDVINLSHLFWMRLAKRLVLFPAVIDGLFVMGFLYFLRSTCEPLDGESGEN